MTHSQPARTTTRRIRIARIRVAGVLAAITAALGSQLLASSSSRATSPIDAFRGEHRGAPGDVPGAANLDPVLHRALRQAAADAAGDGVELVVESGRRSPAHQAELFREAVSKYGSEREAARWVATPNTSAHVSGDAVDVGPSGAAAWLSEHGAEYGLCQIYANEPWHYELRPDAVANGCPPSYSDPTQDPRMQQ